MILIGVRVGGVMVCVLVGLLGGRTFPEVRLGAASRIDAGKASIEEGLKRVSADVFTRTDRVAEDITELKAILALDPKSAEAHMLLGIAYRRDYRS